MVLLFIINSLLNNGHILYGQDFLQNLSPQQEHRFSGNMAYQKYREREAFQLNSRAPLLQGEQSLRMNVNYEQIDFDGKSHLPSTYRSLTPTLSYRKQKDRDHFWGLSASVGSTSNDLFANSDVIAVNINYIQRLNHRWILFANYGNNRTFLNNIPLPGFAYMAKATREETLILGAPFLLWRRSFHHATLTYQLFAPYAHLLRMETNLSDKFKLEALAEQSIKSFKLAKERDTSERIFFRQRQIRLNFHYEYTQNTQLKHRFALGGGYDFGGLLFQAKRYGGERNFPLKQPSAPFLSMNYSLSF